MRQYFVHYLIEQKHYPEGLLANEVCLTLGPVKRRCDTVLYNTLLQPQMIIEYKAPLVSISQKTFDQLAQYNHRLKAPWLTVSNGVRHFCCRINEQGEAIFLRDVPEWSELQSSSNLKNETSKI